jgi:hypothetical protein
MSLHLAEIAQAVTPGAHAVVLLDQAGWHLSKRLKIPANITLVPLPSKAPELNPMENVWQFMRENWLSNRVFTPTPTSSTTAAQPGTSSPTSLAHHVHRTSGLDSPVLINETWYKPPASAARKVSRFARSSAGRRRVPPRWVLSSFRRFGG